MSSDRALQSFLTPPLLIIVLGGELNLFDILCRIFARDILSLRENILGEREERKEYLVSVM